MAAVTGTLKSTATFTQTPATGPLAALPLNFGPTFNTAFKTSGTLLDQVDLAYYATLTFVASTAQTLDLTALTDVLNNAVNFARVRGIGLRVNSTTDAASLLIGAAGTNEWNAFLSASGTLKVPASTATPNDAWFVLTAPNTTGFVVDGTHKALKLTPSAHAFTVDVVIVGCSV
jgi:hypothetical protein